MGRRPVEPVPTSAVLEPAQQSLLKVATRERICPPLREAVVRYLGAHPPASRLLIREFVDIGSVLKSLQFWAGASPLSLNGRMKDLAEC